SDLGHLPAPIQDLAAGRLVHAREQARDRALAASTLADQSDDLVGADDEVDVVDRVQAPAGELPADVKVAREPDGADDRLRGGSLRLRPLGLSPKRHLSTGGSGRPPPLARKPAARARGNAP